MVTAIFEPVIVYFDGRLPCVLHRRRHPLWFMPGCRNRDATTTAMRTAYRAKTRNSQQRKRGHHA